LAIAPQGRAVKRDDLTLGV